MLISGHLRIELLKELGYTHVDVVVVECDETTHYALMVHANRHQGEFDEQNLVTLLSEIELAGIDAAIAGFDHKEMLALLEPPPVEDDSEHVADLVSKADQLQAKWQIEPGDLLHLGTHRLLCGDCSDQAGWQRLLPNELKADMLWCDPPYNVGYDGASRKRIKTGATTDELPPDIIQNDSMSAQSYGALVEQWFRAVSWALKPGAAVYIAHADSFTEQIREAARQAGWKVAQTLIWVKQSWVLSRQDYEWQHEPIIYGWKLGAGHFWQGGFSQATVIEECAELKKMKKSELIALVNHLRNGTDGTIVREPKSLKNDVHPTIKPTRLVARHIWNSSKRGETVAEITADSGTTFVAAEKMGRRAVGMELEPKYCAVTAQRFKDMGIGVEKLRHAA